MLAIAPAVLAAADAAAACFAGGILQLFLMATWKARIKSREICKAVRTMAARLVHHLVRKLLLFKAADTWSVFMEEYF